MTEPVVRGACGPDCAGPRVSKRWCAEHLPAVLVDIHALIADGGASVDEAAVAWGLLPAHLRKLLRGAGLPENGSAPAGARAIEDLLAAHYLDEPLEDAPGACTRCGAPRPPAPPRPLRAEADLPCEITDEEVLESARRSLCAACFPAFAAEHGERCAQLAAEAAREAELRGHPEHERELVRSALLAGAPARRIAEAIGWTPKAVALCLGSDEVLPNLNHSPTAPVSGYLTDWRLAVALEQVEDKARLNARSDAVVAALVAALARALHREPLLVSQAEVRADSAERLRERAEAFGRGRGVGGVERAEQQPGLPLEDEPPDDIAPPSADRPLGMEGR